MDGNSASYHHIVSYSAMLKMALTLLYKVTELLSLRAASMIQYLVCAGYVLLARFVLLAFTFKSNPSFDHMGSLISGVLRAEVWRVVVWCAGRGRVGCVLVCVCVCACVCTCVPVGGSGA